MARKRCKTTDALIRQMWARMGMTAAQRAISLVGDGKECVAEGSAMWAEIFFDRAGGNALRGEWL